MVRPQPAVRRRVVVWVQQLIPPRLRKRLDPSGLCGLLCVVAAGAAVAGAWRMTAVALCGAVWTIARAAVRTRGETMRTLMQITGRLGAIDAATVLYGESYVGAAPLPYTGWPSPTMRS